MNFGNLLVVIFVGVIFGGWPVIGKYSGASNFWIGALVAGGTGLVVFLLSARNLSHPFPTAKGFGLLLSVAVLNGIGLYLYTREVADPSIPTGLFVVSVAVVITLAAPLLDWMLNRNTPTFRHTIGFACAVAAIYLLRR